MKKLMLILGGLLTMATTTDAHRYSYINSYADAIVFDEMGITFAVYPDGEFDFYFADGGTTTVSNGYVNATFNSGYDYSPFVQYDDYGAVIQVENVPVFYDWYGRVSQIGDVQISYRDRRLYRVGGLVLHYNRYGHYAYHSGFINVWNPYFVYRPFYTAFVRPTICFVHVNPYRQFYTPVRYTYYRPYVQNIRPCYATVGHTYSPSGHVVTTHHRYSQSAGRGEVAVRRERQTITRAMETARPAAVNREAVQQRSAMGQSYERGRSVQPTTGVTQRVASTNRTAQPVQNSTSVRRPESNSGRTVNTTSATRGQVNSTGSSRPTAVAPVRNGSSAAFTGRGTSTQVQKAPARTGQSTAGYSRTTVSKAPTSTQQGGSRIQTGASTRSSVSKPATSSGSRSTSVGSTTSRNSSGVSTAPSRSSTGSTSKGAVPNRTASKRGN
ncbi:MAG: hypothetical protein EP314_01190 [Bacteroidetes bacterium]|nr:MAG: hypothetical protein EP314_01190 [Bacteroidota bacterium]